MLSIIWSEDTYSLHWRAALVLVRIMLVGLLLACLWQIDTLYRQANDITDILPQLQQQTPLSEARHILVRKELAFAHVLRNTISSEQIMLARLLTLTHHRRALILWALAFGSLLVVASRPLRARGSAVHLPSEIKPLSLPFAPEEYREIWSGDHRELEKAWRKQGLGPWSIRMRRTILTIAFMYAGIRCKIINMVFTPRWKKR
jgi:hypothetical protein